MITLEKLRNFSHFLEEALNELGDSLVLSGKELSDSADWSILFCSRMRALAEKWGIRNLSFDVLQSSRDYAIRVLVESYLYSFPEVEVSEIYLGSRCTDEDKTPSLIVSMWIAVKETVQHVSFDIPIGDQLKEALVDMPEPEGMRNPRIPYVGKGPLPGDIPLRFVSGIPGEA